MPIRVAILREPGFPTHGQPDGLTPIWIANALGDEAAVQFLTASAMRALDPTTIDLLILPYGDALPAAALDPLRRYVGWGGNILTTGGRGISQVLEARADGWTPVAGLDPYFDVLARFGFKWYQPDVAPSQCRVDLDFLPGFEPAWEAADSGPCVTVNTGDGSHYSHPPAGNAFPERFPVRCGIPLISGTDRFGRVLKHSVQLVKDWRSHGRWAVVAMSGEGHVLDPRRPQAAPLLRRLARLATHPLTLHRLETDLPCYRDGEAVQIACRIRNRHGTAASTTLRIEITAEGQTVHTHSQQLRIAPSDCAHIAVSWPGPLTAQDYAVRAWLEEDGAAVDRAETGFVRWDPALAGRGRTLQAGGRYFRGADGACELLHGMNYYESRLGELMWLRPDPAKIDADLAQMAALGIRLLRPHYHHGKWFRDYSRRFLADRPLPFDDFFAVCAEGPQPAERDWRVLDLFVQLCHKHGITFHPDLFTLVPEEMGSPIGWIGAEANNAVTTDPARIAEQDRFIAALAARYRDWPGIFWDLWNEPDAHHPRMRDWTAERIAAFRAAGDTHPVTLGTITDRLDMPRSMAALCMHGETTLAVRNLLPYFAHETWNSQGCSLAEEDRQRRRMLYNLHASYGSGACGFQPWGWTRQARLRHDMWGGERWDDELGIGTRDDGVLKPSGRVLGDGNRLFDRLGLVERSAEDILVVYPAGSWDALTNVLSTFTRLLHQPLTVGYHDLAEGLASGARVVCLVDPPDDLPAAERDRLLAFATGGGVLYQSGGRPLLTGPSGESSAIPGIAPGATEVASWSWAFAGDLADERLGAQVDVASLFDAEITTWFDNAPGERWGAGRDCFNAGIRPGSHFLWRATVELPAASEAILLEQPIGLLAHRQAIGEFGIARRNLWVYVDGRLVGTEYGWGESYLLPCVLPAGRHEILLVVRDQRGAGGVVGRVALGATAPQAGTASWTIGRGRYLHASHGPERRDRRLLPPIYRRLLADAALDTPDADGGDGELYRLPTARGTAWVAAREPDTAPGAVRVGAWRATIAHGGMLHLVDGQPVLAEALQLDDADGLVVAGEGGTALVDSLDGRPIARSRRLRLKLREGAGAIRLRHAGRLLGGGLLGDDGRIVEPAQASQDGAIVTLRLDAETVHSWTELTFATES